MHKRVEILLTLVTKDCRSSTSGDTRLPSPVGSFVRFRESLPTAMVSLRRYLNIDIMTA